MGEKLGGLAIVIFAVAVLCLISAFEPPVYVQIVCGLGGAIVFLFGVVFFFAENRILTKDRKSKKAA